MNCISTTVQPIEFADIVYLPTYRYLEDTELAVVDKGLELVRLTHRHLAGKAVSADCNIIVGVPGS